jgi:hypothetical protein
LIRIRCWKHDKLTLDLYALRAAAVASMKSVMATAQSSARFWQRAAETRGRGALPHVRGACGISGQAFGQAHEIESRRERRVTSLEDGRHQPKASSAISSVSDRATVIAGFRWNRRRECGTVGLCHRAEWHNNCRIELAIPTFLARSPAGPKASAQPEPGMDLRRALRSPDRRPRSCVGPVDS